MLTQTSSGSFLLPDRASDFYEISFADDAFSIVNEAGETEVDGFSNPLRFETQSGFSGFLFSVLGLDNQDAYPVISSVVVDGGEPIAAFLENGITLYPEDNEIRLQAVNVEDVVLSSTSRNVVSDNSGIIQNFRATNSDQSVYELNDVVNLTMVGGNDNQLTVVSVVYGLIGGDMNRVTVTGEADALLSLMPDADANLITGGSGFDQLFLPGDQDDFMLLFDANVGSVQTSAYTGGSNEVVGFETVSFNNGFSVDLGQLDAISGLAAAELSSFIEFYIAYFNRAPDAIGLAFWGNAYANGTTLEEMAEFFIDQDETRETYPDDLDAAGFATAVYNNVLGRVPDQAGFDFWVGTLEAGTVGRPQFILAVLEGAKAAPPADATPEFVAQQEADQAFLADKVDIGSSYAIIYGMSNVENASRVMAGFDGSQESLVAAAGEIVELFEASQSDAGGQFLLPLLGVIEDPLAGLL